MAVKLSPSARKELADTLGIDPSTVRADNLAPVKVYFEFDEVLVDYCTARLMAESTKRLSTWRISVDAVAAREIVLSILRAISDGYTAHGKPEIGGPTSA